MRRPIRTNCTYPAYERRAGPPGAIYYRARCLVQFTYDYADAPGARPRTVVVLCGRRESEMAGKVDEETEVRRVIRSGLALDRRFWNSRMPSERVTRRGSFRTETTIFPIPFLSGYRFLGKDSTLCLLYLKSEYFRASEIDLSVCVLCFSVRCFADILAIKKVWA